MPAYLALFLCYAFIAWLLRRDMQWRSAGSSALLIPAVWIGIIGSRPVTYWLSPVRAGITNLEGSAANTVVLGALMFASVIVLARRNVSWGELVQRNKALFLIYGFFVISASWSELPGASFKRVVKDFGCVLVALVVLTERDPMQAFRTTMVRVAYVLFPLSLVFIKYFPHIGRQFTRAGDPMFTGVTIQKNSLGEMLFVFLLVIIWDLIAIWRQQPLSKAAKLQKWIHMGMIFMGSWLLLMSDSKTSQVCFAVGLLTLWATGRLIRMRNGKQLLTAGLAILIGLASLDKTFHLSETVIRALGRNPNLTGRTDIWKAIMDQKPDHEIGEGFYIFWDTEKGKRVVDALITVSSAHQGYLEVYIDGGAVGCVLLGVLLLSGLLRIRQRLFNDQPIGRIGLVFWATALVYNLSESSFFRLDPLWFVLLLVLLEMPQRVAITRPVRVQTPQRAPARVAQTVH